MTVVVAVELPLVVIVDEPDEVAVDVSVVDGDVTSQPQKLPENCLETISFSASARRLH